MAISKFNLPVLTEGGVPNANNLSDEMQTINALAIKTTRSNVGQLSYTSLTSGITYNTVDYISDASIYNKGETGLYNLIVQELDEYMLKAEDIDEIQSYSGTGIITITGWVANTGDYAYQLDISLSGVTVDKVVDIYIDKDSMDIASVCELCPTNESYNGGVILYSKYIPTSNISFTYKF